MERLALVLALFATVAVSAAWHTAADPDPADLLGTWQLDLRPTPDAAPYFQEFVVTSVAGDSIQGTFYGTPIEHGQINTAWGAVHFAFVTSDLSGPYNHAGRIEGERIEGSTYSNGRDFFLPWRAARATE